MLFGGLCELVLTQRDGISADSQAFLLLETSSAALPIVI